MQKSDMEGIEARGVAARQAGKSFYENPFYFASGSLEEWFECCAAWSAGWLKEDAGRDEAIARKSYQMYW